MPTQVAPIDCQGIWQEVWSKMFQLEELEIPATVLRCSGCDQMDLFFNSKAQMFKIGTVKVDTPMTDIIKMYHEYMHPRELVSSSQESSKDS